MLLVTNTNFSPEYLMADAAPAIGNGFKSVFGNEKTVIMCESHMKRAVDRRQFHDQNNREPLKAVKLASVKGAHCLPRSGCQKYQQSLSTFDKRGFDETKSGMPVLEFECPQQTTHLKGIIAYLSSVFNTSKHQKLGTIQAQINGNHQTRVARVYQSK